MTDRDSSQPRRPVIRWLRSAAYYLLLLAVCAFLVNLWMTRNQATGSAPVLAGETLAGDWHEVDFRAYDESVVLYFFADWCPICGLQHDAVSRISKHHPVIAIAMQSGDHGQVASYLEQQGLELDVINDPDAEISRAFGVQGVPSLFFVDPQGMIYSSTTGYTSYPGIWFRL